MASSDTAGGASATANAERSPQDVELESLRGRVAVQGEELARTRSRCELLEAALRDLYEAAKQRRDELEGQFSFDDWERFDLAMAGAFRALAAGDALPSPGAVLAGGDAVPPGDVGGGDEVATSGGDS